MADTSPERPVSDLAVEVWKNIPPEDMIAFVGRLLAENKDLRDELDKLQTTLSPVQSAMEDIDIIEDNKQGPMAESLLFKAERERSKKGE